MKGNAYKAILLAVVVFVCVFVPVRSLGSERVEGEFPVRTQEYDTVLTLWNIDTFEGGKGSRTSFLSSVGKRFRKGTVVLARSMTAFGAEESLRNGELPDMVSFGGGCPFLLGVCQPLGLEDPAYGGTVGDRAMAIPWCAGGYFLFTKTERKEPVGKLYVSLGENNFPLVAKSVGEIRAEQTVTVRPTDGCRTFLSSDGNAVFLGTQRDVFRLEKNGAAFLAEPLEEFSDLFQYIAVCTEDSFRRALCEEFVKFLLSEEIQKGVVSLGMFPAEGNPYREGALSLYDRSKTAYTVSPFLSEENAAKYRDPTFFGQDGEITDAERLKSGLKRL